MDANFLYFYIGQCGDQKRKIFTLISNMKTKIWNNSTQKFNSKKKGLKIFLENNLGGWFFSIFVVDRKNVQNIIIPL